MKKSLQITSILLAMVMALSTFSGCSGKKTAGPSDPSTAKIEVPDYMNATGFPIVKKPVTLTGMVKIPAQGGDHSTVIGWQEYEKMTGIHIDWQQLSGASAVETKNLALASGDYPDIFWNAGISETDLEVQGENGVFIALDDLISKYAPNFKKVMTENVSIKKGMRNLDGKIYSLPYATICDPYRINKKYINQDWLEAVGMKMPTTTDELFAVLKAFRGRDPNGNGQQDEIPLTDRNIDRVLMGLRGAWNLANRGTNYSNWDIDPKTNQLRFVATSEEYKELLQYVNKLYSEKLLDQEIFANTVPKITGKLGSNVVGAHDDFPTNAGPGLQDKFIAAPVLKGPRGDQAWTWNTPSILTKGAFVITSKNKYPEASLKWADYFYSEDGMRLYNLGIEGKTYTKGPDGKNKLIDDITNNPDGLTLDAAKNKYLLFMFGPTVLTEEYFTGSEMYPTSVKGTAPLKPYTPKEVWEKFNYTKEESAELAEVEGEILKYINQMKQEFITGKTPFSAWDEYVAQIKSMGYDKLYKNIKLGYERYNKD